MNYPVIGWQGLYKDLNTEEGPYVFIFMSAIFCDWSIWCSGTKQLFPMIFVGSFVCEWIHGSTHMHLTTCTYISVCLFIYLCAYINTHCIKALEVKMLNYLILHMLQSQCESNYLKKKKKEKPITWSNLCSLSFISQLAFSKPVTRLLQLSVWPGGAGWKHTRNAAFQQLIWEGMQDKMLYPQECVAHDARVSCVPILSQDSCLY